MKSIFQEETNTFSISLQWKTHGFCESHLSLFGENGKIISLHFPATSRNLRKNKRDSFSIKAGEAGEKGGTRRSLLSMQKNDLFR